MKKLLISSDCFLPRWDGIARFLAQIIPVLAKKYKITVVAPHFPGRWTRAKGVKYVRFPVRPTKFGDIQFSGFNYHDIKKLVKEHDVVFNQTVGPIGMSAIRAANKTKVPIVHYVHSIDWELASKGVKRFEQFVYKAVKLLTRSFHNKTTMILYPSHAIENIMVKNKVKTPGRVVPMGIDTKVFSPSRYKSKSRIDVDIPDRFTVGFVGRIAREKDLPTLVEAFKQFRVGKDVQLLIVGGGLTHLIPQHEDIIATGSKGSVQRYLRAMDVFVLPSLTETSSLATMEAMACGLPVLATPVGSIPEYVQDGKNGLLFAQQDVKSLVDKLDELYENDKLRKGIGKVARETIVSRYSKKKLAEQISSAIDSVIKP